MKRGGGGGGGGGTKVKFFRLSSQRMQLDINIVNVLSPGSRATN